MIKCIDQFGDVHEIISEDSKEIHGVIRPKRNASGLTLELYFSRTVELINSK